MPYEYQAERPKIFIEDSQVLFLKIRVETVAAQHRNFVLSHGGA